MKLVGGLVMSFLLGAMFVSLFVMSAGMDMSGSMTDCPFMAHEQVLCPMNLVEHIAAWKAAFTLVLPILYILLGLGVVLVGLPSLAPHLLHQVKLWTLHQSPTARPTKWITYPVRAYQELFASGVLHPKLF
ncbi:hypothetical protein KC887_06280 [Candidatus Kaiserbacteria bacterium]|nr:hypothetical protein [Candidatus Kaiserbacteria bacterium]